MGSNGYGSIVKKHLAVAWIVRTLFSPRLRKYLTDDKSILESPLINASIEKQNNSNYRLSIEMNNWDGKLFTSVYLCH